ncbi:hypothetical protein FRD53_10990 [Mycobacterium tuberculosis]|nr:hypothetical protein EUB05_13770 [Mycobacterium tuberculosis]RXR76014.1 hypothetical protein EUB15_05030 [Mycobacterium tuberculosis]TWS62052.1 hypothetical protein FRD57_10560 [Mycobacterium tuberculosis]TWS67814.1 hypothetical protein FRD70_09320 [Mycobacterium tuberculosis]TWS81335.1 hypothetical protein FRD53_10990 [Mycobacterium tuberculosis]
MALDSTGEEVQRCESLCGQQSLESSCCQIRHEPMLSDTLRQTCSRLTVEIAEVSAMDVPHEQPA